MRYRIVLLVLMSPLFIFPSYKSLQVFIEDTFEERSELERLNEIATTKRLEDLIVSVLSDPPLLKTIAARSYHHANGFMKLTSSPP